MVTYGGIQVLAINLGLFFFTFIGALILELVLFFVAMRVAEEGKNSTALPLLGTYSLLSGYTLAGLVPNALQT